MTVNRFISRYSFIYSGYFYSASSSPLKLRGAPDSTATVSEFHAEVPQATVSERLAQGPHEAARAGFETTTLWTKGNETTNRPQCLTICFNHTRFKSC